MWLCLMMLLIISTTKEPDSHSCSYGKTTPIPCLTHVPLPVGSMDYARLRKSVSLHVNLFRIVQIRSSDLLKRLK